jgi:hypothetical protein
MSAATTMQAHTRDRRVGCWDGRVPSARGPHQLRWLVSSRRSSLPAFLSMDTL